MAILRRTTLHKHSSFPPLRSQTLNHTPEMATAGEHDDGVANCNVVYLDTTLDTHLAMIVSDSDAVSDFKRKIMLEHRQLFPANGDVKVECVKVKRRGSFYHLSDSMLVKSAFGATKGNWFASVDASRSEQNDGIQQLGKHKAGDQLALLWVTHGRSIERHDNHGSPSVHSKTAPLETASLVSQKVLKFDQLTSGDSCKDASKNAEEDRLCNDKQLDYEPQEKLDTVNTDINLKKRKRGVHNESPLQDDFGYGPSAKKKHKTERGKSYVKASEETLALTHDNDKVKDDHVFEHKTEGTDLSDENKRIDKDENCSDLDQVATVLLSIKGVGNEIVGDVAMVVGNNIQQQTSIRMPQKEKDGELVQKPTMEGEIPSSLMSAPAGVTARGYPKRSTKHKAAEKEKEKEVSSTSFIEKLHKANKEATKSSPQQNVGSNGQECGGDQIDKHKDDSNISLKQRPELKLPGRKKGATGCENTGDGKRRKTKKLFKHSDNLVGDISSKGLASVIDERKTDEVSEEALVDAKKGDDVVMNEVEISVENMEEQSRKDFTDTNESVMNNDADISTTVKNTTQVNAQGILDNLEKHNEKTEDATKKKKKRKNKKTAGRNEEGSITKHVNRDVCENVKESESGLLDTDRKDGEREKHEDSEKTLTDAKKGDDVIVKEVEVSVENVEEKSRKEITDTNDAVTVTNEDNLLPHSESPVNNDADISTGMNKTQVNVQGILDNVEKQNEKLDDTTKKKRKKKSKTKKSSGRNEDESVTKHVDDDDVIENVKEAESSLPDVDRKDGDKANKSDKPQDLQSKHQSTGVELESKKSRSVDHHHLPVEIPENESKFFADSRKDMKNTKVDSENDRSQKLVSKNENSKVSVDVIKDPNITNIDKFKTPKRTKIDAQKTNRQPLSLVQSRVKTAEKKKVNSSQKVKSLLNKPGTIFGDDADSDSSTRAPSHKSSSSSSSSPEEDSSYSLYSRRNRSHARKGMEGAGKNNINSQNESKNPILGKLLRSSSAFKKAKVTASQVEDTVESVPDSQP